MSGIKKGKFIRTFPITSKDHLYFEELLSILLTFPAFVTTMQLVKNKYSPMVDEDDLALAKIGFPIEALKRNEVYEVKFVLILQQILKNEPVESIIIKIFERPDFKIESVTNSTYVKHSDTFFFIRKMMSACFVIYYEKAKDIFVRKYGMDSSQWPSELNFARTVRNAFAHDGKLAINNLKAPAVSWNRVTYSPTDNGKSIYDDFFIVEIIDLMDTINNHIK